MDAAPERRLQRRSSVNILTAWPGRVASATRAGRARDPWSCSPCWRPSRDAHGSRTSYSSTANRTRKLPTTTARAAQLAATSGRNVAVGDLPTSSVSAPQLVLETLGSAPTPPALLVSGKRGCFLRTRLFLTKVPGSPHTSSHMFGHHPATVRRAGRKRGARFESSEALAEQPAVVRSAVELHRC